MFRKNRIVIGSLRWERKHLLDDVGLKVIYTNFAGAAVFDDKKDKFPYKGDELDATLLIEGEHKPEARKLGTVSIGQTSILALQDSITEMKAHPKEAKWNAGKLSIALGIGSPLFCCASMAFWAMRIPDELKENAQQIIMEFENFKDGEFAWLDSAHPKNLFRDNMNRLNKAVLGWV